MNQGQSGRFLVIEGIDGSGKSTQIKKITQALLDQGKEVIATCEPTDGPVGTLIRKMLSGKIEVDQHTIAQLFAADRTDHLLNTRNGVKNCVDTGQIVVCDRYYFSSYAYHAQYIDMDWVIQANSLNAQILRPHATLFIDVDPQVCLDRIQTRGESLEIYEKIDIMKAVRANYFESFDRLKDQETVIIIDGNGSPEQVFQRIWDRVCQLV